MSKARLTAAAGTPEQRTVRAFLNAHADLADVHATNADGHNAAHVALEEPGDSASALVGPVGAH